MSKLPQGKIIGYMNLFGPGPLIVPADTQPAYKYDGRECDDPRRLPSHMDAVGSGRKLGWACEGCGAESPRTFRGIPSLVIDAKQHDCK